MATQQKIKGGKRYRKGGGQKHGFSRKGQFLRYKNERRHEKSHIRRIARHLARYGENDKVAVERLKVLKVVV